MKSVNENDAQAAMRTWMAALSEHARLEMDYNVQILSDTEALVHAFESKHADCLTVTTEEFLAVDRVIATTNLLAERGADGGDSYLLLAHERSGITNVANLKGRALLVSDSMRMSLAQSWLDVLLMRDGLPQADQFFRSITRKKNLPQIILPVFFRTAEVCLVPKRGFDAMVELNPQVGKQLRVIAQSERYVAGLLCFRGDYLGPHLKIVTAAILNFQTTTHGQQVLTLFQSEPVAWLPRSSLTSAITLIEERKRLSSGAAHNFKITAHPPSGLAPQP